MVERSEQIVLDYLFSSDQGEIVQRNGRDTNRPKIGERTYQFVRGQALTDRLKRKLKNIKQTIGYKKYELENKRGIRWTRLDKNKALIGIQKRYKANITDKRSAFGSMLIVSPSQTSGFKASRHFSI